MAGPQVDGVPWAVPEAVDAMDEESVANERGPGDSDLGCESRPVGDEHGHPGIEGS